MYSKIFIIGNLGRDPEMRYLPNGQSVTNMNVASNRVYTNSEGTRVTETIWYRITAWGDLAENCNQYLQKGRRVFIEGRLSPDPETGNPRIFFRNDGSAGASYEVVAGIVRFLDSQGERQGFPGQDEHDFPVELDPDNDIPF